MRALKDTLAFLVVAYAAGVMITLVTTFGGGQ